MIFEEKIKTIYKEVTENSVVEKFEVGIEKINYDTVETSSKNLKVSRKSSTRSTSNSSSAFFQTSPQNVPILYNVTPPFPSKLPLSMGDLDSI